METLKPNIDKRILYVPKDVFKDLSEAKPKESGYIILYNPEETKDYYALGKVKVGQRKNTSPTSIDTKVVEYLVENPDMGICHYMSIEEPADMAENLGYAIALYSATQGSTDLFAEITNGQLEFFQLMKIYGYRAYPMPFSKAENSVLLRYGNRLSEIIPDLSRLNSPGKV